MKKRVFVWIVLVVLVFCCAAHADLKRGSSGKKVREMQQYLTDLGFLNDKVDGKFGKKTEAAVKWVQRCWGLKETGKYDSATEGKVLDLWFAVEGYPMESGLDPEELMEIMPSYCSWSGEDEGNGQFCYRHENQMHLHEMLVLPDLPENLRTALLARVNEDWETAIGFMYDEWLETAEEDEAIEAAETQREAFDKALEEHRADWAKQYGEGTPEALYVEWAWLEQNGIDMCFEIYGAEGEEGTDDGAEEDDAEEEPAEAQQ